MLHNISSIYSQWLNILFYYDLNMPLILPLKAKENNYFLENKSQICNENITLLYMILMWTILYYICKKGSNVYFRKIGYAFVHRNRISHVLWSCSFTSIIILYTLFLWNLLLKPELSVIILKSFYLHYGIVAFINYNQLRGLSNFLFILFIFGSFRQILEPPITNVFILKAFDTLLLDCCRILYLKWPIKVKQCHAKRMYIIYSLVWIYVYTIVIPQNLLLSYKYQSLYEKLLIWLWLTIQFLEFVWSNFINLFTNSQLLEFYLFSKPSRESIYLTKILHNHKKIISSKSEKAVAAKKFWQILKCGVLLKKKVRRLRAFKQVEENKVKVDFPKESADENITD